MNCLKKTLAACLLPLALLAAVPAMAAPNLPLFNSILNQERAWAGLQTKTVMVDGINASYSEGGPADAPKVLLIHGFSGSLPVTGSIWRLCWSSYGSARSFWQRTTYRRACCR